METMKFMHTINAMCFSQTIRIFVHIFGMEIYVAWILRPMKNLYLVWLQDPNTHTPETMHIRNKFCKCIVNYLLLWLLILFAAMLAFVALVFSQFSALKRHIVANTSERIVCQRKVKFELNSYLRFEILADKKTDLGAKNIANSGREKF